MTADVVCRDCRRPLRDPESRAREYGSRCWLAHAPIPARPSPRRTIPRRRTARIDGQTELDLEPQETP